MTINSDNIHRHELIGLNVIISDVKTPSKVIKGRIIDETKNVFLISSNNKDVKIIKSKSNFNFKLSDEVTDIVGTSLVGRPEDRVKLKLLK